MPDRHLLGEPPCLHERGAGEALLQKMFHLSFLGSFLALLENIRSERLFLTHAPLVTLGAYAISPNPPCFALPASAAIRTPCFRIPYSCPLPCQMSVCFDEQVRQAHSHLTRAYRSKYTTLFLPVRFA